MALIQTSKIKTITITLISLQFLLLASIFIIPVFGNGLSDYNNNNKSINENVKSLSKTDFFSNNNTMTTVVPFTNQSTMPAIEKITNFGSWAPYQIPLESIKNIAEQKNVINAILKQGYNEYYFPMIDFKSKATRSMTENLLQSANGTKLKIIIILLPPSEAGPKGNFNWNSWIEYLNFLKTKYPSSLDGFVIDDFNLFNNSVHANKVKGNNHDDSHSHSDAHDKNENKNKKAPKETVTFMLKSKLEEALQKRRKDLHFYPVLYFEGVKTNDVKRHFYNNTDGIVLASTNYYNVTDLDHNLKVLSKVFNNKPIRYVVYTDRTSNFIDSSPPSDRLVLSTLSIANESGVVKGVIIWRNTNSPVIRDYLSNRNNTEYMSFVSMMGKLQLKDENSSNVYGLYNPPPPPISPTKQQEQQQNSSNHHHNNDKHKNEKNNSDHNNNVKLPSSQPSSSIPPTPRLGISTSDLTPSLAEDMGLPKKTKGAAVQSVILGSPAYNAGLKGTILDVDESGYLIRRGDVITSVDGHKVNGVEDMVKQMKKKHLGDLLSLIVSRNGQILNMVAKL
ncbi:MAG: PDZ domain-containing protein [Nitrososphaeraceae archaeon]